MRPYKRTFISVLEDHCTERGSELAFIYHANGRDVTEQITFLELRRRARSIAAQLLAQPRNQASQPVLLACDSTTAFIVGFFGALYANALPVPVPVPRKNQKIDRLRAVLESSGVRTALLDKTSLATFEGLFAETAEQASLSLLDVGNNAEDGDAVPTPSPHPDQPAFLQYTSGSTSAPRGVTVTHRNLICNSEIIARAFDHGPATMCGGWLPPFHDMGLIGLLLQSLYLGTPCVLMPPLAFLQHPIRWLQLVSRYGITTTGGPNFGYDLCVQRATDDEVGQLDLSSLTVAFNGAEPVDPRTIQRFCARFAEARFRPESLFPCYGLAEGTLMVTGGTPHEVAPVRDISKRSLAQDAVSPPSSEDDHHPVVSCGYTRLDTRLAIVGPGTQRECKEGSVGEIWVRGTTVTAGYWGDSTGTTEVFGAFLETGEGPFLRTGDLGFVTGGHLYVTGRIKDLIIIRGDNYYPQDIERLVGQHHALVGVSGAAFTVPVDGQENLVVVHEVNFQHRNHESLPEVAAALRTMISAEFGLTLTDCAFVKRRTLPLTSSGKLMRGECRRRYLTGTLHRVDTESREEQANVAE